MKHKLIMENWQLYEQRLLWEQEFDEFFNKHFVVLEEGFIDWAVSKGRDAKQAVMGVINDMKDWTAEKIKEFVQFMGKKMQAFLQGLRDKGLLGKWQSRKEQSALRLLMTNKHFDLAVMIFTTIAKMTGGFIVDKVAKMPELIQSVLKLLDNPVVALKELFGDISDIKTLIQKFMAYREDRKTLNVAQMGDWSDFGGLV